MAAKLKSPGLEAIIASMEKELGGKGIIVRYGDIPKTAGWDTMLSFGYPDVDEASNCGGIARGKKLYAHPVVVPCLSVASVEVGA